MKLSSTTKRLKSSRVRVGFLLTAFLMLFAVIAQPFQVVSADPYSDKIKALEKEIDRYQAQMADLADQAKTLQGELSRLSAETAMIQAQVDISQQKYDKLLADIKQTEKDISANQEALGDILADMYVDDQISPIEMLASSNTIGDFLDKQEYRSSIRDELLSTINRVRDLKAELEKQKKDVEKVLADQKAQRDAAAAKENERKNLLDKTKGEEAAYQSLVKDKNSEMQKLLDQQAAYFASLSSSGNVQVVAGDPNKGGYPAGWANAPQNAYVDSWGMYSRQCTSYVAWKVHQAYTQGKVRFDMPYWGGRGNAWQWGFSGWHVGGMKVDYNSGNWHTSNAQAWGIPSGAAPKKGSIAVQNADPAQNNPWGHVAWVEDVYGNGTIKISQYNWYNAGGSGWGHYSEMIVSSSLFQRYIYVGDW